MALGLPTPGGGDRTPIVKYDARAGRIFRVDRTQNSAGGYDSNQVEITPAFQAVFDLEKIELGWLNFPTNMAPDIQVAPYGQPMPPRPSAAHRAGFRVHMLLGKTVGGDVREMAANAQASIGGMDDLHDAYLKEAKNHPGKLPVVKLAGTKPVTTSGKGQSSTNYQPIWEITSWVDRPEKLSAAALAALKAGTPKEDAKPEEPPPPKEPVSVEDDF